MTESLANPTTPFIRNGRNCISAAVAMLAFLALPGCGAWRGQSNEQEVEALLAQPSVEPLTRYVDRYRDDEARRVLVDLLKAERARRCGDIAESYEGRAKTPENLVRLERNYGQSCPEVVKWFAEAVAEETENEPEPAKAAEPEEKQPEVRESAAPAAQISAESKPALKDDPAMNECRTLFMIRNYKEALAACTGPAEGNQPEAQFFLGEMYATLNEQETAVRWVRKSAMQGYTKAQFELGRRLLSGQGVPRDVEQGTRWLRRAAVRGDARAQEMLGQLYADGRLLPKARKKAAAWYLRAAENGDAKAQCTLGRMYLKGDGVARNAGQAKKWLLKAAHQGHLEAQRQLAEMLRDGIGGETDFEQAYIWYGIAAKHGDAKASEDQFRVAAELNQTQIDRADREISRLEVQLARQ